ncbi:hypothetical protein [Flavobacterium yafengii]|uniref:hypothetical protein n=1 Tax=Flavobacterium yafengii TaxID=3041253 RepID=UPI0024A822ED|nr:hypothetical protein [Flavobacterium yafengii]MDI6047540.1 hypothetical protein [Flavobacterium yafengii]
MKTIQFKTQDQTQWTIFVNQITSIYPSKDDGGTWVYLSCGTKLKTAINSNTLLKMINGED